MAIYLRANNDLNALLRRLLDEYHPELVEVKIDLLWAISEKNAAGDPVAPAILHQGYQAYGLCKINSLQDRALGLGDVRILLDQDLWGLASEDTRAAMLDHEIEHIHLTDKTDDLGRPIIKMKRHDVQVGWFSAIAQRHGAHSVERTQAGSIFDEMGQSFWPQLSRSPAPETVAA